RVLHRIRETRGGALYDSRFGVRGRGEGLYAEAIRSLFETTARSLGIEIGYGAGEATTFRRPPRPSPQLSLF
ncbi:MAG TPA: radical SAM protein, partial [Myxococcaceae bacterium]|nr:radical SAM protein [Myxococcaceae bacterium]